MLFLGIRCLFFFSVSISFCYKRSWKISKIQTESLGFIIIQQADVKKLCKLHLKICSRISARTDYAVLSLHPLAHSSFFCWLLLKVLKRQTIFNMAFFQKDLLNAHILAVVTVETSLVTLNSGDSEGMMACKAKPFPLCVTLPTNLQWK